MQALTNATPNLEVVLHELSLYLDYEGDESYTPRTISIRCGMTPQGLVEVWLCCCNLYILS